MEQFINRLENLLRDHLGTNVQFRLYETMPESGRVGGHIVWAEFENLSQRERQAQVWNVLRQNLNPLELQQISAILTLSSAENASIMEREPVG